MTARRAAVLLAGAILLAGGLSACGSKKSSSSSSTGSGSSSGGTESKAQWADQLCSALSTWQKSLQAAGSKASGGQVTKESLQSAFGGVEDANKQLRSDLQSLGKPPTPTAAQARDTLEQLATDLTTNVDKVKQALSGSGGLAGAATAASSAATAMSKDVQNAGQQLQSLSTDSGWQKAFQSSASCRKLTGS
jgi:hypothetical protein